MKHQLMKGFLRVAGTLILGGLIGVAPLSAKNDKKTPVKSIGKVTDGIIEYYQGDLSFLGKNGKLKTLKKGAVSFKSDKTLFSGQWKKKRTLNDAIKASGKSKAVVRLNKQVFVTLAGGSGLSYRTLKDGTLNLKLTGAAHIFAYQKDKDMTFSLRGVKFSTQQGHFYVTDWDKTPQIVLVDGAAKATGMFLEEKASKKGAKVKKKPLTSKEMKAGSSIIAGKKGILLVKDGKYSRPLYQASLVSGINRSGAYRFVGVVEFSDGEVSVKRFEKLIKLSKSPALISQGDEIQTASDQTAVLSFFNKDKIRLFSKTKFTINQYPEKTVKKPVKFGFLGKIRAKITKRKKFRRMFFKTATAIIGIKGTEFETSATAQVMSVKTVEGIVGVTDPSGGGEVLVNAGQQTKVESGKLPEKPIAIPPEELKKLNAAILTANQILEVRGLSIQEGAQYQSVTLQFTTLPTKAPYQIWVNGKLQKGMKAGAVLKGLKDGVHTVTIKGVEKDLYSQTVRFIIDNQKPSLILDDKETKISLKEGDPLYLKWKEKLKEVSISFGTLVLKGGLDQGKQVGSFDSTLIFQNFKEKKEVVIKVKAVDLAGNISELEQHLKLRFKPEIDPVIQVVGGDKQGVINSLVDFSVKADRKLMKWVVLLDGKGLEFSERKAKVQSVKDATKKGEESAEKGIVISLKNIKDLKEGKHILSLEGEDDFGMKGKKLFSFIYDKTKPVLISPLKLIGKIGPEERLVKAEKLILKEGEKIQVAWSELVKSPLLKFGKKTLKLKIDPENNSVVLSSLDLMKVFKNGNGGIYELQVSDLGGNISIMKGVLEFKVRPKELAQLKIGDGSKKIHVSAINDFVVQSTQSLYNWKVSFDEKEIKEKEKIKFSPGKKMVISKALLGAIKDGEHRLKVSGVDSFSRPATMELVIVLDTVPPQVDKSTLNFRLNKVRVKSKQQVEINWTEKILLSSSLLEGKKWNLKVKNDGKTLVIYGDPKRLNYEPKAYLLKVKDAVGNETTIAGKVSIQKPRTTALKDNYKGSILLKTDNITDKVMLSNRLPFTLNESTAGKILKGKQSLKAIYKTKNDYRLNKILDEPLINSYHAP